MTSSLRPPGPGFPARNIFLARQTATGLAFHPTRATAGRRIAVGLPYPPTRSHGMQVRVFSSQAFRVLGIEKGHMRRKAHNRLLAALFTLLLSGAVTASRPNVVHADAIPTNDPSAPPGAPPPNAGDPDIPSATRNPKPNPGAGSQTRRDVPVQQSRISVMIMQLRLAFLSGLRFFFRIV